MNKRIMSQKIPAICVLSLTIGIMCIGGCGKNTTKSPARDTYRPGSITPNISAETTTANNLKVTIRNITAEAGSDIDYLGAIEAAENMELEKSMIYVDSSQVDCFTPGVYTVYYTFDYMGMTVNKQITVTITPKTDASQPEESTDTADTVSSTETPENVSSSNSEDNTEPDSSSETTTSRKSLIFPEQTTNSTSAAAEEEYTLPDAVITLSTGKTVTISCTPSRYIVETYTEDTYSTEQGFTYLTSKLKILMNTGEIQVIETVVTRVAGIPEN